MRNLVANMPALSDDANGAFVDQTLGAAGALTLDGALVTGGVAYFAQAQKISIEGTGNNSGVTATITGTDADGTLVSEALTLANNGTATSVLYYKTITSITVSAALTGNIEGGPLATNGAVSRSLRVNGQQMNFKLGLFVDISGTLTYSAQYTYMQPEDEYAVSYSASADWRAVDGLSALSADAVSNIAYKVNACRLLLSAYTSGTAKLTVTQSY
jgi:hypothetical protein